MNRPDKNSASIEATLDDFYASEMNIALSWSHRRGFHVMLGNPPLAKKSLPKSEEAVRWLRAQALHHFPRTKFQQVHKPGDADPRFNFVDLGWRLLRSDRRADAGREMVNR
jgi:hypothetical protein